MADSTAHQSAVVPMRPPSPDNHVPWSSAQPEAMRTAAAAPTGDGVLVTLVMNRVRERAAAVAERGRLVIESVSQSKDIGLVASEAGPDEVKLVIETTRDVPADPVVPVKAEIGGQALDYLVTLVPEASGRHVGDLLISGVGELLTVKLRVPPDVTCVV